MQKNDLITSYIANPNTNSKIKATLLPINLPDYKRIFSPNKRLKSSVINQEKEKEQMAEEIIHLKSKVNDLQHEISILKSEIIKKETETNKKEKLFEKFFNGLTSTSKSASIEDNKTIEKVKIYQNNNHIKKQYKKLKSDYNEKCNEIENLKKEAKLTKQSELNLEIFTLNDEFLKLKAIYLELFKENEAHKTRIKNFEKMEENYSNQQLMVKSLQEKINGFELEKANLMDAINELNNQVIERNSKLAKMTCEARISSDNIRKLFSLKKAYEETQKVVKKLEIQIIDLQKQIILYRDVADKKDKIIKEFEKSLAIKTRDFMRESIKNKNITQIISLGNSEKIKNNFSNYSSSCFIKNDQNNINNIDDFKEDYKYFEENPENKLNKIENHLRNRLNIIYRSYFKIHNQNKYLSIKSDYLEGEISNILTKFKENISYDYKSFEEVQDKFNIDFLKIFNENEINNLINLRGENNKNINEDKEGDLKRELNMEVQMNMENNENNKNHMNQNNVLEAIEEFNTENMNHENLENLNINGLNFRKFFKSNYNQNYNFTSLDKTESNLTLEEFSYVIVKNLEARKINVNLALKDIFDSIIHMDKEKIKLNQDSKEDEKAFYNTSNLKIEDQKKENQSMLINADIENSKHILDMFPNENYQEKINDKIENNTNDFKEIDIENIQNQKESQIHDNNVIEIFKNENHNLNNYELLNDPKVIHIAEHEEINNDLDQIECKTEKVIIAEKPNISNNKENIDTISHTNNEHKEDPNAFENIINSLDPNELIGLLKQKLINLLKLQKETDQVKLEQFLIDLCERNERKLSPMMQQLVTLLSSAKGYKKKREIKYKQKLVKVLFIIYLFKNF